MKFTNRQTAGRKLATELLPYKYERPIVIALPRGGVPIGFEIAEALQALLEILVVRKIGAPHNPEFGVGAIAEHEVKILDDSTIALLEIPQKALQHVIKKEQEELIRRVKLYRGSKSPISLETKTIILVDDGLATGVSARAAIAAIKKQKPKQIIFASPVCVYETAAQLEELVDKVVCIMMPVELTAIAAVYQRFEQTTEREVMELLQRNRTREK